MLPYLVVFAVCIVICSLCRDNRKWPIFVVVFLLSLLAGLRDKGVGTDTLVYTDTYFSVARRIIDLADIATYKSTVGGIDKGFLTLAWIGVQVTNDMWCFYFLIELVITLFLFLGVFRLNKNKMFDKINILIFFLIWFFLQYNFTYNAMRQACAMSIMFFSLTFAFEKKWTLFVFWSIVAFLFHSTSLVVVVILCLWFVSNIKDLYKRRVYVILCVVVCIVVVFAYSSVLNYVNALNILNKDYSAYDEGGRFEGGERLAYYDLLLIVTQCFLIVICRLNKLFSNQMLTFHLIVLLVYFASLFLGLYNVYAARIGLYFSIVSIYLWTIELSNKHISKSLFYYITIGVVLFSWLYRIVYKNAHETIPYTSSILGI